MRQRKLKFARAKKSSALRLRASYDARNLACAELIIADKEQYSGPGSASLVQWAERVIQRLGNEKEKEAA